MGKGFIDYSLNVGKILANIQALELLIRRFLYDKADHPFSQLLQSLNDLKVGDTAPENPLTDWRSLSQLIACYNERVTPSRQELVVDSAVVALRDALAHARVWLPEWPADPDAPPMLLKFARPSGGSVAVEFMQVASPDWLDARIKAVSAEIEKVVVARREL